MEKNEDPKTDFEHELSQLTAKQRAFVLEFVRLRHVTRAALNAGYSPRSAYHIGSENLSRPMIRSLCDRMISAEIEQRPRVIVELKGEMMAVKAGTILRIQGTVASRTQSQIVLDDGVIVGIGTMKIL